MASKSMVLKNEPGHCWTDVKRPHQLASSSLNHSLGEVQNHGTLRKDRMQSSLLVDIFIGAGLT
jgi:hypothetical protein